MMNASNIEGASSTHRRKRHRAADDDDSNANDSGGSAANGGGSAASQRNHRQPSVQGSYTSDMDQDEELLAPSSKSAVLDESTYSAHMKSIKGTQLEPLLALLATQPEELHPTIIAKSKAMLALTDNIKQRESSHKRFDEPMVLKDDKGQPIMDEETGEPKTVGFIPRSVRKKVPVVFSADVKEDRRAVGIKERARAVLEKYQSSMAELIKEASGLEIKFRKEQVSSSFLDTVFLYAQTIVIIKQAADEGNGSKCTIEELAHNVAVLLFQDYMSFNDVQPFYFDTNDQAKDAYVKQHNVNLLNQPNYDNTVDTPFCHLLAPELKTLIIDSSVHLIQEHEEQDKSRTVNSALKEFLGKLAAKNNHEDLELALDNDHGTSMEDLMQEIAKKATNAEVQKMKSILRKKSSGGAEVQTPQPTKPGRKQSKKQGEQSKPKSKKQSKKSSSRRGRRDDSSVESWSDDSYESDYSRHRRRRSRSQQDRRRGGKSRGRSRSSSRGRPPKKIKFSEKDKEKSKSDRERQRERSRSRDRRTSSSRRKGNRGGYNGGGRRRGKRDS